MMKGTRSDAESHAERLLRSLAVSSPQEIDVEAIAWVTGVEVRYADLDTCEARIIGFRNRAIITVQRGQSWQRQRFSIGHELGHWCHHRGRSSICRASEIGSHSSGVAPVERVADRYAADLLLPSYLFRPLVAKQQRSSFTAIDTLANEFETSRVATAIRFVDLGPWPCMLVCHGSDGRRWFRRGPDIPDHWFPRDELDAESCAMDVLHGSHERTAAQLIGADAWFDRRNADRFEITEQSIRTFEGDVLTLLTFRDEEMLNSS